MATKKRASVYMLKVTGTCSKNGVVFQEWPVGAWVHQGRSHFAGPGCIVGASQFDTMRDATRARAYLKRSHMVSTEIVRFVEVPK